MTEEQVIHMIRLIWSKVLRPFGLGIKWSAVAIVLGAAFFGCLYAMWCFPTTALIASALFTIWFIGKFAEHV